MVSDGIQNFVQQDPEKHLHVQANFVKHPPSQVVSTSLTLAQNVEQNVSSVPVFATSDSNFSLQTQTSFATSFVPPSPFASIFTNQPRQRAESFVLDEVKILLQEIACRKYPLLSISPSTNRLKRRAWEEVAASMASRCPNSPRRTADQVKKKWENLVTKTKRKIRAGHLTPELDWSEANSVVMEFLAQHSPLLQLRYNNFRMAMQNDTNPSPYWPCSSQPSLTTNNFAIPGLPCASAAFTGSRPPSVHHKELVCSPPSNRTTEEDIKCDIAILDDAVQPSSNIVQGSRKLSGEPCIPDETRLLGHRSPESSPDQLPITNMCVPTPFPTGQPMTMASSLLTSTCTSTMFPNSMLNSAATEISGDILPAFTLNIQHQLTEQLQKEHLIRMEILNLQKRSWELQLKLLENALANDSSQLPTSNMSVSTDSHFDEAGLNCSTP